MRLVGQRILLGFAALLCALSTTGCWLFSETVAPPPVVTPNEELPESSAELMELAEAKSVEDAHIDDLDTAIAALEKLLGKLGTETTGIQIFDVRWRLARACFMASELEKDSPVRLAWIAKGEDSAEAAVRERPERVEGYYYLAVLKGRRAELSGIGFSAIALAKKVEELGKKAVELDPSFEDGAPYRLLAMLYANAPPWPTSIGDMDLALELAEKAVELSDYPMNHLIMAEVLIEDEDYGEARAELKKVLSAPKVGRWAREGERWRPRAMQLMKKLEGER